GSYNLATNAEVNKSQFQTVSPWLERSDINFTYPMFISDLCKINTSSLGDSYYYFFYDWVLRKKEITCESNRIEVKVNIITDIDKSEIDTKSSVKYLYGTNEISFQNFLPNTEITIFDIQSKIVLQTKINSDDRLSVSFPSGQYIILAKNRDIFKHFKLLKYE
ncbi:MAG: T9SS type A sorting domain-containing protein, partial [Saprospiraceae bacterium]